MYARHKIQQILNRTDLSVAEQIQHLLTLGAEQLCMTTGSVHTLVDAANTLFQVAHSTDVALIGTQPAEANAGCTDALRYEDVIVQVSGSTSHIGMALPGATAPPKTLCFSHTTARSQPFSEDEKQFVRELAYIICDKLATETNTA